MPDPLRVFDLPDGAGQARIDIRRKTETIVAEEEQRHGFLAFEVLAQCTLADGNPCCREVVEVEEVEVMAAEDGEPVIERRRVRRIECDNPDPLPHRAPMREVVILAGALAENGPLWLEELFQQEGDLAEAAFGNYRSAIATLQARGITDQPTVERRILERRVVARAAEREVEAVQAARARARQEEDAERAAVRQRVDAYRQQQEAEAYATIVAARAEAETHAERVAQLRAEREALEAEAVTAGGKRRAILDELNALAQARDETRLEAEHLDTVVEALRAVKAESRTEPLEPEPETM